MKGREMQHGNDVYNLQVRVPYVWSFMVNATLLTDCYHLTITPFKNIQPRGHPCTQIYTCNIELATH